MDQHESPVIPHPQCKEKGEHSQHAWMNGFGRHVCPGMRMSQSDYCTRCARRRGVGCACDMTFAEKIKTVQVDRESLKQPYRLGRHGER